MFKNRLIHKICENFPHLKKVLLCKYQENSGFASDLNGTVSAAMMTSPMTLT